MLPKSGTKVIIFSLGLICGFLLAFFTLLIAGSKREYFKTTNDYCIENAGILKSGTTLQFDRSFAEGFTRYILYVNLPGGASMEKDTVAYNYLCIPYWLRPFDPACIDNR